MTTAERPVTLCEAFGRTASIDPDIVVRRTYPDVNEPSTAATVQAA